MTSRLQQTNFQSIHLTGFALLLVTLLAGCRIPPLRNPTAGPEMPPVYSWNNGLPFGSQTPDKGSAPSSHPATSAVPLPPPPIVVPAEGRVQQVSYQISDAEAAADKGQSTASVIPADSSERLAVEAAAPQDTASSPATPPMPAGQSGMALVDIENSASLPLQIFYNDPYLSGLIQQALVGNQELKKLSEEIQIARNEAYARSGEYLPFVSLGTGVGIDKSGKYTRLGALEDQLEVAPGRDFPEPLPDFMMGSKMSWEIDIWQRLRNAQRAAAMRYLGTQEGRNFVVTRLVAEIAENYYSLLALDNRLLTLDKTIEIQRESLRFAEANKAAGRGTELAVQRFVAEIQKNEAEKTVLRQEVVQIENRINFLLGRYPQPVERISSDFLDLNLDAFGTGVPSELLQQRADIRQAEREVEAAGLDVKSAKARFYPSLNLTGGLGWNAFSTGYLLKTPESLVYGLGSELIGPLINKRAIKAAYCSANAAQLQSIYNYQQTILRAHIEVVNQITKIENYRSTIATKRQQLAALEASVNAAKSLFQNARAEYIEVLLAQREMMEARMQLLEIKREQLSAIVNAYQALGGGAF